MPRLNGIATVFLPLSAIAAGFGLVTAPRRRDRRRRRAGSRDRGARRRVRDPRRDRRSGGRTSATSRRCSGRSAPPWPRSGSPRISSSAPWLVLAWSALGVGLAWLGARTRDERFFYGAATLVGYALLYTFQFETPPDTLVRVKRDAGRGVALARLRRARRRRPGAVPAGAVPADRGLGRRRGRALRGLARHPRRCSSGRPGTRRMRSTRHSSAGTRRSARPGSSSG